MMTWLILIFGGIVLWVLSAALGIFFGRRAPTRKAAFSNAMTATFISGLLLSFCANVFLRGFVMTSGAFPVLLLFAILFGFAAGVAATFSWTGPLPRRVPLSPHAESEARARFDPHGPMADTDAIQGVRQETMQRSDRPE